jgi:hypothetical protein
MEATSGMNEPTPRHTAQHGATLRHILRESPAQNEPNWPVVARRRSSRLCGRFQTGGRWCLRGATRRLTAPQFATFLSSAAQIKPTAPRVRLSRQGCPATMPRSNFPEESPRG